MQQKHNFETKAIVELIGAIGLAGMDIKEKAIELERFGTCVIGACQIKKKKLDNILNDYNGSILVTEYDTNKWRLTFDGVKLSVLEYCREVQCYQ